MAVTSYHAVNRQILGETTTGTRTDYLSDALGSVTATANSSGVVQNRYRYKPYGARLAKTGGQPDPRFLWTGDSGSRSTRLKAAEQYNRRRHYSSSFGAWTSVDPLWPNESAYRYASGSPVTAQDPSGLYPDFIGCGDNQSKLASCCHRLAGIDKQKVKDCMRRSGWRIPGFHEGDAAWFLDQIVNRCTSGGGSNSVCVRCASSKHIPAWSANCPPNPCAEGFWGYAYPRPEIVIPGPRTGGPDIDRCGLEVYGGADCSDAYKGTEGKPCSCSIIICESAFTNTLQHHCAVLYHELAHCTGLGHVGGEKLPPGIKVDRTLDFIYKLGCCICTVAQGKGKCGEECKRVE